MIGCPNRGPEDYEWICLCGSRLDGSFVNGWLPLRLRNRKLADGEDRAAVIKELEDHANDAFSMWRQTC